MRFDWTEECQSAFEALKAALMQAPVLAMPDFSPSASPFVLDTDASAFAVGGVLSQKQADGIERPIAYASHALTRSQRNYEATKREMYALVHFAKYFRPYLLGKQFVVRMDHRPLLWLKSFKEPQGMVARWIQVLEEYDFQMVYRPGSCHTNADALSRIPQDREADEDAAAELDDNVVIASLWVPGARREELVEATRQDPELAQVMSWLQHLNDKPSRARLRSCSREIKAIIDLWDHLRVHEGVLYLHRPGERRVGIIPAAMRGVLIHECHTGVGAAHEGRTKTYDRVRDRFWWPSLRADVIAYLHECEVCAAIKGPKQAIRVPLQTMATGRPMECIEMDIIGPLSRTRRGNIYILCLIDLFSKWAEAIPLPDQQAATVAHAIVG